MTFCHTVDVKPIERLEALAKKRDELPREIADTIDEARADGATWQQIADILGVSRTGAMKTYSRHKETNQ